jgi:hypothetical protein
MHANYGSIRVLMYVGDNRLLALRSDFNMRPRDGNGYPKPEYPTGITR